MTTAKEYYAQKQRLIRYKTLEVHFDGVGTFRFVKAQTVAKKFTLESTAPRNAGESVTFAPVNFLLNPPEQNDEPVISVRVQVAAVGQQVRELIDSIGAPMAMGEIVYREYLEGEIQPILRFYVPIRGVDSSPTTLSLDCRTPNYALFQTALIQTPDLFEGLRDAR